MRAVWAGGIRNPAAIVLRSIFRFWEKPARAIRNSRSDTSRLRRGDASRSTHTIADSTSGTGKNESAEIFPACDGVP